MGLRFIFMLTRNDRTVEDAAEHLETALAMGVRHIGFKDIGLPVERLKALNDRIKAKGATSYLEVVSLDRRSEITSARAAVEIGVDILLGGTRVQDVLPIVAGTDIAYYPFPGHITGHPSVLEGSIEEIAASAKELASHDGVHGLDLLAYRSELPDIAALISAVTEAAGKPVIVAGSIANKARIREVKDAGAAGFTIGTAALDGDYPTTGQGLTDQLGAIVHDVADLNGHLSQYGTTNLTRAFQEVGDTPISSGSINGMNITLLNMSEPASWRFHKEGDVMFMLHSGRLLMKFRDREEIIDSGEFIIVPKGVDHCPIPLTSDCKIVLFKPN